MVLCDLAACKDPKYCFVLLQQAAEHATAVYGSLEWDAAIAQDADCHCHDARWGMGMAFIRYVSPDWNSPYQGSQSTIFKNEKSAIEKEKQNKF